MTTQTQTLGQFLLGLRGIGALPAPGKEAKRLPRPGRTARVYARTYLEHLKGHKPCLRLLALFVYEDAEGLYRYFWHDLGGNFFVRMLTAREARTLCRLANLTPAKRPATALPEFELRDFQPGERFRTPEGILGVVAAEQPGLIDHLQVELETPRQRGGVTFLRKDLRVRPADRNLARRLARRARRRAKQDARPFPANCCHCGTTTFDHNKRRMRDHV